MDTESLLNNYKNKTALDTLTAEEWNECMSKIEEGIEAASNSGSNPILAKFADNIEYSGSAKNNLTLKSDKHINIEPAYTNNHGDIQLKPGDDISFYSHHREADKTDEVSLKVLDGSDKPVKLLILAANLTFSTKDKDLTATFHTKSDGTVTPTGTSKEDEIFDININTGKSIGNKKGYLKVRARAIDLRCEEHGGIALQPKGKDANGNMNKIKFEHGGGDGLEFGTFNTEHTSLFTDDYRFNRNGLVKMVTREMVTSDKKDSTDATTFNKYVKLTDDTYDIIDSADEQTTWHDIIKTSYALNHREADDDVETNPNGVKAVETSITSKGNLEIATRSYTKDGVTVLPNINLESARDININAQGKLSLSGALSFGSTFQFGETDKGIEAQVKYTSKGAEKHCDTLKLVVVNNSTTELTYKDVTCPVGETTPVASCSLEDLITLVNWTKENSFGPWATEENG